MTAADAAARPTDATLARVLAEVGEMLQAAPGELDASTDLVGAGLDSIRAMVLAERWGLGFLDLVTGPTPGAWARLLDAREG